MIALHPFGDPQTVAIAADADDPAVVYVTWKVGAADDLTLLGIHLGVVPEDRVMLDGAITYDDADADAVAQADELDAYLLDHIRVGDGRCSGEVVGVDDLVKDGARLAFACPAALTDAEVEVSTLTDLHPAYRTLATGPDGQHHVYTSDAPQHSWVLGRGKPIADDTATSAAMQVGGVLGVVLLIAGAVTLFGRRRRSTIPTHH